MRIHKAYLCFLVAAALIIFGAVAGHATTTISGQIWQDDTSDSADVNTATLSGDPNALFTVTAINFNSNGSTDYTPALFLGTSNFTNPLNSFSSTASLDNTHITLVGQIYLNAGANNFDITHDDGVNITLSGGIGNVVDSPGPTGAETTPFTITATSAGTYTYTVNYNECDGAPAVLDGTYTNGVPVGTVPVPSTGLLLGGGLLGLVGLGWRKRTAFDAGLE